MGFFVLDTRKLGEMFSELTWTLSSGKGVIMDIVERLRGLAKLPFTDRHFYSEWGEAADAILGLRQNRDLANVEIERLRAALEEIDNYMEHRYQSDPMKRARNTIQGIASKALKQSENDKE